MGKATGGMLIYLLLFLNNIYIEIVPLLFTTQTCSVYCNTIDVFMTKFLIQNILNLVMYWLLTKNIYCSFLCNYCVLTSCFGFILLF
jgi:hypothetical protein